jgi:hypothetical protein
MRRLSPMGIRNIQTLRSVYFAHFLSLVNHRITLWGNTNSTCKVFLLSKKYIENYVENKSMEFL